MVVCAIDMQLNVYKMDMCYKNNMIYINTYLN